MNQMIRTTLGAAAIALATLSTGHAAGPGGGPGMGGQRSMMGDPARMQQMMEHRNQMMKSTLNLTPAQEARYQKFAGQQQEMMKSMMQRRQKMMQGGGGRQGMMQHMTNMRFDERMKMMQENAERMQAMSRAGMDFYNSLSPEQQKKLNDMPKQMQGRMRQQQGGQPGMQHRRMQQGGMPPQGQRR